MPHYFTITEGSARTTWTHKVEVWDSYYEYQLGEKPDRTYYRSGYGKVLHVLQMELRHRPLTPSLPDR